ncbi:glutathione S-transferase [Pontivivens nitratireducens]|uniref:Glutathione S-transferase n=1 Tax=Pontivivens nitratireducens TaxID=2758038 RepID=A0A6G7VMG3_9RHOB|nr:glutathione S-transferase [Pontibrevibacter nitratireducens]QIK41283.1 glutathione S-transferase [Pontibrevibacter nitratireducens]
MKLYDSKTSPYCRKVMVLAHEAGQVDALTLDYVAGTAVSPGTLPVSVNPLGKIPCLVRPDGPALYDSRVICAYLDDLWGTNLYPTGTRRWETLTLEATADGMLDAALLWVYEVRLRDEAQWNHGWRDGQVAKVVRALDALEARWLAHLHGPLDMGQIAIGVALGYLDFRQPVGAWREGRPALAAWYETFSQRPSMLATVPVE